MVKTERIILITAVLAVSWQFLPFVYRAVNPVSLAYGQDDDATPTPSPSCDPNQCEESDGNGGCQTTCAACTGCHRGVCYPDGSCPSPTPSPSSSPSPSPSTNCCPQYVVTATTCANSDGTTTNCPVNFTCPAGTCMSINGRPVNNGTVHAGCGIGPVHFPMFPHPDPFACNIMISTWGYLDAQQYLQCCMSKGKCSGPTCGSCSTSSNPTSCPASSSPSPSPSSS